MQKKFQNRLDPLREFVFTTSPRRINLILRKNLTADFAASIWTGLLILLSFIIDIALFTSWDPTPLL